MDQFNDPELTNAILLFSDGRAPIDPRQIATDNENRVGIFPVGIGDDLDRARLEMTAALNYGFVTYVDDQSNLKQDILQVFEKINAPILREPAITFQVARNNVVDRAQIAEASILVQDRQSLVICGGGATVNGNKSRPIFAINHKTRKRIVASSNRIILLRRRL